jgi:hypothetical protein
LDPSISKERLPIKFRRLSSLLFPPRAIHICAPIGPEKIVIWAVLPISSLVNDQPSYARKGMTLSPFIQISQAMPLQKASPWEISIRWRDAQENAALFVA